MVLTRSLAEPAGARDGLRLLITRYRPRGVRKGEETWDAWERRLAPSVALLDALRGKVRRPGQPVHQGAAGISWEQFTAGFRAELAAPPGREALGELAARLRAGERLTLLCHCQDAERCHRTLVAEALRAAAADA